MKTMYVNMTGFKSLLVLLKRNIVAKSYQVPSLVQGTQWRSSSKVMTLDSVLDSGHSMKRWLINFNSTFLICTFIQRPLNKECYAAVLVSILKYGYKALFLTDKILLIISSISIVWQPIYRSLSYYGLVIRPVWQDMTKPYYDIMTLWHIWYRNLDLVSVIIVIMEVDIVHFYKSNESCAELLRMMFKI